MSAPTTGELAARVASLEKVVIRLALGISDLIDDRAEEARRLSQQERFYDLTEPLNDEVREATFNAWEEQHRARADAEFQDEKR